MKFYELTYLISSDLSEEEAKNFQEKIVSFVQEEGGILGDMQTFLGKKLAYLIKKSTISSPQVQAYLVVLNFQLNPANLANLEKKLKSEGQIIRYLILSKPPTKRARLRPIIKKPVIEKPEKEKVKLKEIEEKIEEILGGT